MKYPRILWLFLISGYIQVFSGCITKDEVVYRDDFEKTDDGSGRYLVNRKFAHSGDHYVVIGPGHPFSPGYERKLSDITSVPFRRIDIAAWIRIENPAAEAYFVLSIDSGSSPVYYQAKSSKDERPYRGEWTRTFNSIYLPAGINQNFILKVYFWNKDTIPFYIDDLEIHMIR
ncbi:MAG: hypothetical protein IT242_01485 [Bacteroidia bacterium]|nr:hypothetical protein [Bacteroidia bacterium]